MVIFLTVLKVIAWILLVLLGLLVLALFLALFVPVRYRMKGTFGGKSGSDLEGSIVWLFHLVRVYASLRERKALIELRVLWFRKTIYPVDKQAPEAFLEPDEKPDSGAEPDVSDSKEQEEKPDSGAEPDMSDSKEPEAKPDSGAEPDASDMEDSEVFSAVKGFFSKVRHLNTTIQSIFSRIQGMIKNIRKNFRKLRRIWEDERNQLAMRHMKKELIRLWKCIFPKKFFLRLHYSAGTPDYTGILLGLIAIFPTGYQNRWQITPDFETEQPYAEGAVDVTGRLRSCHVVASVFRLLFDKNCRRMRAMIMKYL